MDYQEYLKSDEWRTKRQLAIQQADGRCRICNSSDPLDVHHRSYDRLRTPEEVLDIIAICRNCHERFHKKIDNAYVAIMADVLKSARVDRMHLVELACFVGEETVREFFTERGEVMNQRELMGGEFESKEERELWIDVAQLDLLKTIQVRNQIDLYVEKMAVGGNV